ncbi:MAG: hypothetical protein NTY00_10555 [Deltaproteobacteria bacterium]|nr:hypothetical protein [Deltaproteobacteria bacterium]
MGIFWDIVNHFTAAERWIYGLGTTTIAIILGQWVAQRIGHELSVAREKKSILRSAFQKYKSSFAPEIAAVSNNLYAIDTFSIAFERHEAAVDAVRPILPKDYQRKLQEAWDNYCGKDNNLGFDAKGFVQATSATLYSTNTELFQEFKKRFHDLHSCLDKLK